MLSNLNVALHSLAVFHQLKQDAVLCALSKFLDMPLTVGVGERVTAYTDFVAKLYASGIENLSQYISRAVNNDENVYIRTVGKGETPSPLLCRAVEGELAVLSRIAALTEEDLRAMLDYDGYLPPFESDGENCRLAEIYRHRTENIGKYGYGIYADYHMFYLSDVGQIIPVQNPDPIRLSDLIDYKREQQIILDNTHALLSGKPAANMLLTGDAGTGKSSTVKAVVNELYSEGLRILEIRKEQLHKIPAILDELTINPLKFILFIDDLSFQKDDDNYSALKAILEGSVSAKSQNVVVYATSNRRHLVKEKHSDRDGDEVHRNDTMQEIVSLSERFGLRITFNRPDKATYLDIVHHLADAAGIAYTPERIDISAERYALSRGTRSARAAKQFVDTILAGTENDY
ncbi:MAG: ATP-binding protein [Clostridia bacterium]|nr:ATP-binding protein [Clostridia bacterium]